MQVEIKKVKLSQIKLNPDNPRNINKVQMDRLVKSLREFPEMLEIREIVTDEDMITLGGNMRLRALREAGAKECIAKIVTGLTPKQRREFIVKDNGQWGSWDFDVLANAWDDLPLVDWGVDIPKEWGNENNAGGSNDLSIEQKFMIVIDCESENQQVELLGRFQGEGLTCKALIS